jgi:hypothetical protein
MPSDDSRIAAPNFKPETGVRELSAPICAPVGSRSSAICHETSKPEDSGLLENGVTAIAMPVRHLPDLYDDPRAFRGARHADPPAARLSQYWFETRDHVPVSFSPAGEGD